MAASFFFYDVETSGFNPRSARIMQFAGQRTTLQLEPVGEPVNVLIKLSEDVLPEPDAVLITGITPQQTRAEGQSEAEFLKLFGEQVVKPDTIFVGFNSVRFDDEFMRYLMYRNFYDPYEWQWQDGRSRWDLLDVVRMTRALRPNGIEWPFAADGKPSNRLELITGLNKLRHDHAHDALGDVLATIEVAKLIHSKAPKLFEFLLAMRDKKKVAVLAAGPEPFVYTSGKYPSEFEKTTVVCAVAEHPKKPAVLVYDLRHDPAKWKNFTPEQLAETWRWKLDSDKPRLPVKTLSFNRCPAVAPLSVLDEASQKRLKLDMEAIDDHQKILRSMPAFADNILKALAILDKQQQTTLLSTEQDVDANLYDGFINDKQDQTQMRMVRAASSEELSRLTTDFKDERLKVLLPLYKARNFPASLNDEERVIWEGFRIHKLLHGGAQSQLARFMDRLQTINATDRLTPQQEYLLEELKLWAEMIMPSSELS